MAGRIRRKLNQARLEALPRAAATAPICPLCQRPVPASQQDAHHWVPKSQGGTRTGVMHRICHRQIHALFTEAELARAYASPEALKAHPAMARFIEWVKTKPDAFFEKSRKSQRLKSRH